MKALIFDFDGVIMDSESPDLQSWRECFEAHGKTLDMKLWRQCVGAPVDSFEVLAQLERLSDKALNLESLHASRLARFHELVHEQPIMPGVERFIHDAERLGLILAIASSATRDWVEHHLQRFGIRERFDLVKCREDVTRAKPAPDLFQAVLRELDLPPSAGFVLEDSPNGVAAAKDAGLYCVAVPNAATQVFTFENADMTLPSLDCVTLQELLVRISMEESIAKKEKRVE